MVGVYCVIYLRMKVVLKKRADLIAPGVNTKGGRMDLPVLGSLTGDMSYTAKMLTIASHKDASARCIPGHCLQNWC